MATLFQKQQTVNRRFNCTKHHFDYGATVRHTAIQRFQSASVSAPYCGDTDSGEIAAAESRWRLASVPILFHVFGNLLKCFSMLFLFKARLNL